MVGVKKKCGLAKFWEPRFFPLKPQSKISLGSKYSMNTTPSFESAIDQLCKLQLEDTAIATLRAEGTPLKFFGAIEKCWLPGNGEKTAWTFMKTIGGRLHKMSLQDRQLLFGNKTRNHFDTLKKLDDPLAAATCEAHFKLTCPKHEPYGHHPLAQIVAALPPAAKIRFSGEYLFKNDPACHIICDTGMTLLDWLDEPIVAAGHPASVIVKLRLFGIEEKATLEHLAFWLDAYTNPDTRQDINSGGRFIGEHEIPKNCGQATPDGKGVIGYAPDGFFTRTSVHDCNMSARGRRGVSYEPLCSVNDFPNPGNGHVLLVKNTPGRHWFVHFKIPCQNISEQDWQTLVELNGVGILPHSTVPFVYSPESAKRIREHVLRLPKIIEAHLLQEPLPPNHLKDCHYLFSFND